MAQAGDKGRGLPMAMRNGGNAALAYLGPPIAARHLGAGPGFIQEYQLGHIQRGLHRLPFLPTRPHVFTLLLGGVRSFF
jgi:hypothetical protein